MSLQIRYMYNIYFSQDTLLQIWCILPKREKQTSASGSSWSSKDRILLYTSDFIALA